MFASAILNEVVEGFRCSTPASAATPCVRFSHTEPRGVGLAEYEPVLPLDALILKELPPQGTTFADVYPIGENVQSLKKKVGGGMLDSETFSSRLRVMHLFGLVVPVKSVKASTKQWQITTAGKKKLAEMGGNG